jgi:hypothetical protein
VISALGGALMNTIVTKKCRKCGETKPINQFFRHGIEKDGYRARCKSCTTQEVRNYQNSNREKHLSTMANYRHQARIDAVQHYGGKSVCCGETQPEFLAIDHVNGGGNKHQKQIKGMAIGIWLRKHNYPEGFRVLCHNCNMALGFLGHCPHNKTTSVA